MNKRGASRRPSLNFACTVTKSYIARPEASREKWWADNTLHGGHQSYAGLIPRKFTLSSTTRGGPYLVHFSGNFNFVQQYRALVPSAMACASRRIIPSQHDVTPKAWTAAHSGVSTEHSYHTKAAPIAFEEYAQDKISFPPKLLVIYGIICIIGKSELFIHVDVHCSSFALERLSNARQPIPISSFIWSPFIHDCRPRQLCCIHIPQSES